MRIIAKQRLRWLILSCAVALGTTATAALAQTKKAPKLKKRAPVTCKGTKDVTLNKVIIETDGDALTVMGTCSIRVKNSVIRGKRGAVIMGSGDIALVDTTVEGKVAAIAINGSGDVEVAGGSITGAGIGIHSTGSGDVKLLKTSVTGTPDAIVLDGTGDVDMAETTVTGKKVVRGNGDINE